MKQKKEIKSLPFWLIEKNYDRREEYFFYLPIIDIVTMNFAIEGFIKEGEKVLVVDVDGGRGLIPESEFSITQGVSERIIGKNRRGYLKEIVNLEYESGEKESVAIFSTKEYEQKIRAGKFDELKAQEFVEAEVIGFTDYSVILLWNSIRMEMFRKGMLGRHTDLDLKLFLSEGDKVPVKVKRIAKNGRLVQVESLYQLQDPVYTKVISPESISVGDVFTGIVTERDLNKITIQIGREEKNKVFYKLLVNAPHPHPAIDDMIFEGQVVSVKIYKKNGHKLRGSIENVDPHYIDDAIFQFRELLDSHKSTKSTDVIEEVE